MKALLLTLSILWAGLASLPAEEQPETITLTFEEIATRAQSRNLEIRKAERAVQDAEKDLKGELTLMHSRLSLGGGYSYSREPSPGSQGGWSGQAGITLPLIPQLSLGAGVSAAEGEQVEEEVSMSVTPFAAPQETYTAERDYAAAVVHRRYLRRQVYLNAEQAALNLLIRERERELAAQALDLEQQKYELVQRQQELGEASFQDVQDQLVALIDSRQSLFDTEQRYLSDWKNLQLIFAPGEEAVAVEPVTLDVFWRAVERRGARLEGLQDVPPSSEKLETLALELAALQGELGALPVWRPDLSVSAGVGLPDPTYTLSLSLAFSPEDLQSERREELGVDIEMKRLDIGTERYAAALQGDLVEQSIAIAEQALTSARIQEERDAVALQEAELLFQQGRRTSLELEQIGLNLKRAEIQSFRAAVELYRVQGDLLMLFTSADGS